MVSGVPGLGIVADDEDSPDQGALEEFFSNVIIDLSNFLVKLLPFGDEPIYFDSDEEALEMVRKHFPGNYWYETLSIFYLEPVTFTIYIRNWTRVNIRRYLTIFSR